MKMYTCEVCGSHSFAKKGGVFVCKNCLMEYSASDLKGLMSDVNYLPSEDDEFMSSGACEEHTSDVEFSADKFFDFIDKQLERNSQDKRYKWQMKGRNAQQRLSPRILASLLIFAAYFTLVLLTKDVDIVNILIPLFGGGFSVAIIAIINAHNK